jgi:hypothetical protein
MLENVKKIESEKESKVEEYRKNINLLALELNDDFCEKIEISANYSLIEQENVLEDHLSRLQNEKMMRLDEYESLLTREKDLCLQLGLKRKNIAVRIPTTPSLSEIGILKSCIFELEHLRVLRMEKILEYKDEIIYFYDSLGISEFNQLIRNLQIKDKFQIQLSEKELQNVLEIRNELKIKYNELKNEIKCLAHKISYLWSTYGINNLNFPFSFQNIDRVLEGRNIMEILSLVCEFIFYRKKLLINCFDFLANTRT